MPIAYYDSSQIYEKYYLILKYLQSDKDKANFEKLIKAMKESKAGKTLGVFPKDEYTDEFCESWKAALKGEEFEKVDISVGIAYIIAPKEESEIMTIKKSCMVSVDLFTKYLKDNIMEIIDSDKVSYNASFLLLYCYPFKKKNYSAESQTFQTC